MMKELEIQNNLLELENMQTQQKSMEMMAKVDEIERRNVAAWNIAKRLKTTQKAKMETEAWRSTDDLKAKKAKPKLPAGKINEDNLRGDIKRESTTIWVWE